MQLHLNEVSRHMAPKAHGVILMDRAGRHGSWTPDRFPRASRKDRLLSRATDTASPSASVLHIGGSGALVKRRA